VNVRESTGYSLRRLQINKCNKTANINVKKTFSFKAVCNGDKKGAIT